MSHYSRKTWGARTRRHHPGTLARRDVAGYCLHWPAMAKPLRTPAEVMAGLRSWQSYHMDTLGWSDLAYNIAVDQDGNTYAGRGRRRRSAANGSTEANREYVSILLVLAPGEQPSAAMIGRVRKIIRRNRRWFTRAHAIVGHSDVRPEPTACPGPAARRAIELGLFEPRIKRGHTTTKEKTR